MLLKKIGSLSFTKMQAKEIENKLLEKMQIFDFDKDSKHTQCFKFLKMIFLAGLSWTFLFLEIVADKQNQKEGKLSVVLEIKRNRKIFKKRITIWIKDILPTFLIKF